MTTVTELRDALGSSLKGMGAPLVHGNGFILVSLPDGRRAHFWGDHRIPRQVVYSGIHNHRFGFVSEIVRGRMLNVEYHLQESISSKTVGTHRRYGLKRVVGSEDTKLVDLGLPLVWPHVRNTWQCCGGESYRFEPGDYHETFTPEPTITIMTKTVVRDDIDPVVLAVDGTQPDNEFDRYSAPDGFLRTIVADMLT